MNREEYQLYLLTEHWQRLRSKAVERDGNKCVRCGWPVRLQVHHKIYRETPQDTLLEDLETLCEKCHSSVHGKAPPVRPSSSNPCPKMTALMVQSSIANRQREQAYIRPHETKFHSVNADLQNFIVPTYKPSPSIKPHSSIKPSSNIKRYIGQKTRQRNKLAHPDDQRCKVCGQKHPLFHRAIDGEVWLVYRCSFSSQDSSPIRFRPAPQQSPKPG